ncbi:MAG: CehA/McbA family metallohydrolase [Herpetosiphonaceae bacterium]|nr:CehA/McbA family metallohydrolase [Herpetosiphonaceae bacterium]
MHYQLSGKLTDRDAKQHILHAFTVPVGATELRLRFDYTPERVASGLNALHLSLFDSHGFRGAGHRRGDVHEGVVSHIIELNDVRATPGYMVGALPPGEWSVVIDTHMILPDVPVTYQLAVDVSSDPLGVIPAVPAEPAVPIPQRGPGWYRGDLHGHTVHSDASWDIADLLAHARNHRLDFVTLSDHNTVSGLVEFDRLARPELLTMGGIELTTYAGHALALGIRRWIDWRVRSGTRSMPQIAAEVEAAGGLFIIAHPMSVGDPICTGCDWRYRDMLPGPARCVEVWNGGEWEGESNNEDALALWYVWLNQGQRVVATAGTDIHGPLPPGARPGFNVVYAESFSEAAILRAITQGHLYLSNGPQIEVHGRTEEGVSAGMGDSLPSGRTTITACWEGCTSTDRVRLIADGELLREQEAGERGEQHWQLAAGEAAWCVLELRDATGRLRAVTNPLSWLV